MIDELEKAFQYLEKNDEARGIILTGSGDKVFVAGADVRLFQQDCDQQDRRPGYHSFRRSRARPGIHPLWHGRRERRRGSLPGKASRKLAGPVKDLSRVKSKRKTIIFKPLKCFEEIRIIFRITLRMVP